MDPFQLSSQPVSNLQLRQSLDFEFNQTLQHIRARCDGEHSGSAQTLCNISIHSMIIIN